jgi:hypothetical protein
MAANNNLRRLPDDIIEMICSKMPRLADVQALCDLAGRPELAYTILLDRLRTGSWELMENGCQVCNRVRTLHGHPCRACARPDSSDDSASEYVSSDSEPE